MQTELFRYLTFGEKDYLRLLKGIFIRIQTRGYGERRLSSEPTKPTELSFIKKKLTIQVGLDQYLCSVFVFHTIFPAVKARLQTGTVIIVFVCFPPVY